MRMKLQNSQFVDDMTLRMKAVEKWCNRFVDKYKLSLELEAAKRRMAVGQKGAITTSVVDTSTGKMISVDATGKYGMVAKDITDDKLLPEANLNDDASSVGKYIVEDGAPGDSS